MADERTKPPYNQTSAVPAKYNWPTLLKKDGDDLFEHYRHMLESPGYKKTCRMLHQIQKYINFFGRYHTDGKIREHVW